MANTNPPVKLMMLALAAPQEQQTPPQREVFESGQPLVVFLGVQKLESANGSSAGWDEKKWYVGLAKLDEFLDFISKKSPNNGQSDSENHKNLFEKFSGLEIVKTWKNTNINNEIGISDGKGDNLDERFKDDNKTLWIDKIYRVFFFDGEEVNGVFSGCNGGALNQPLLRLDTAAWVEDKGSGKYPGPEWVVTRLRLTCDSSWLEGGEAKSKLLTRFRLVAHIPVAVNSHKNDDDDDAKAKRYDTRVILVADSNNTGGSQSLWAKNDSEDRCEGIIYPHFNQLHLAFSESNGFSGDGLTNDTLEKKEGNSGLRTLKELTDTKNPISADNSNETDNSERVNIPILSCFTDLKEKQPSGFINKIRRRQLCLKELKDKRFALRIESHLIVKDCHRQEKLWDAVVKPFTKLAFPGQLNINENESGCFLVQEQLEEDIFFDLQTPAIKPSRWHLNVRIDPELNSHNIEDLIFEKCNNISQAVRQGLYLARPATGVSFLPSIDVSQQGYTGNPWQLNGRLEQISHRRRIWLNDDVNWQRQAPDPEGRSLTFESFTPVTKNNLLGDGIGKLKEDKLSIKFIKDHDMFVGVNGQSVLGSNQDDVLELSESSQLEKGTVRFGLAFKEANNDRLHYSNFILGALEFSLGSKAKINIQIALQPKPSEPESELNSPLESFMQIDIENFKPVVQDQTNEDKGNEEEQALILELPKIINSDGVEDAQGVAQGELEEENNAEGNAAFRLEIRESVGEWIETNQQDDANNSIWQDQKLDVKLIQNPIAANNKASLNPLLVLDRKPWRAVLVAGEKFTSGGAGGGNNTIAKYMPGDDGLYSWQFFDQKETVTWLLPPQTLGEAMEKRRSEIDIAEDKPAPMRFGSNSILIIDPTFRNPKNYREAGWNLKRILAKITDAPSGALVKELRLELIYGLLTQINPDQEVPVWVTEMQAVIGRAPSTRTVGGGNSFADYGHYVQQILQAQGQRLAVDKLWSGRPEASFLWKENLQFTLRTYVDPQGITKKAEGLQTHLLFPATSGYPNGDGANADPHESEIIKTFMDRNPTVNFPGGVAWAIEEANILGEIYVQGTSNEGQIGNVHLSALGGWGNQRAVYYKSIFETETTMGRLQTYRLERLGRIGGLYNKAKHVTEYQRTVAPSDQFASSQDQLLDRPVLRKTREYIQILEPKKAFSESGEATYETGFLLGSEFVTQRIFVDSGWGRDVRNEGWMVPLWKKQNEQNGYSYPQPEVFLTVVGEDGTKRSVKIESVEKLVFYTSTREVDTAETIDDWPAVEGIDFCDLPLPSVKIKRPTNADSENQLHDGILPKAATVPFGYDNLTLILSESSVPVRITAGRSNEGPAAPIRAVTIGRAAPAKNSELDEELQIKGTALTGINNEIRAVLENWAGRVVAEAELGCNQRRQNEIDNYFSSQLQQLVESIKIDEIPNALSTIQQVDANMFNETIAAIRDLIKKSSSDWTKDAEEIITESIDVIDNKLASQLLPLQNQLKLKTNKAKTLYQRADNTLRVLRAAGPPPKVEGLVINRPQVAYVFDLVKPVVDMTPAVALANRVVATKRAIEQTADAAADLLQPFGVRLPVEGLAADLLPADLGETSLSKLLPDMAGLKLDALLPSLKLPDLSDKVKITRGFDKAKRQAWLNATVDIPLKGTTTLLSFGPLSFSLIDGKISARSRMTIDQNGRTETDAKGEITGNWKVVAGGIEVVTFEKTPLVFEKSGKLDFKLSTKRVKLSPQLQFITNLLEQVKKSIPPGIEPIYRDGLPAGIRCLLAMDLPPISTGVFGITDLTLGCSFGVYAYPEFEITSSLDIGTQLSPFTLAVWLLNGGGYISLQLRYVPMAHPEPLIIFSLDLSIVAGVGIGFAVGVISGAIWIQIGCGMKLELSTGKNSKKVTTIKVMLLIRGNVDIAGIATAGIQLLMEASYNGADMVAKGILRVSIRVSWLYTFKAQEKVKYKLAGRNRKNDEKEYADSYA
jgi:hypothetical protein